MLPSLLSEHFYRQAAFSGSSKSFLYERLFATVGDWLKTQPADDISKWLQDCCNSRSELETSVLLLAAVHREVLLESPGTTEKLREYYPSVGGTKPPTDAELADIFLDFVRQKIGKSSLSEFMIKANVQTNETGRGIFWLLPVALSSWKEIHLVDLGASAGLNLVAEQRNYTLVEDQSNVEWSIGKANANQFTIYCEPGIPSCLKNTIPKILARSGCDMLPIYLDTEQDTATLMSFVFADQSDRIERLKEGIEAFKHINKASPISLSKTDLPDDLPLFLKGLGSDKDHAPLVIYNTFMTTYLRDHGQDLMSHIDAWAQTREKPVLWAQLEPPTDGLEPPDILWCAWTVHLWEEKGQPPRKWQIGWAHPHGTTVVWKEDELRSFIHHFD